MKGGKRGQGALVPGTHARSPHKSTAFIGYINLEEIRQAPRQDRCSLPPWQGTTARRRQTAGAAAADSFSHCPPPRIRRTSAARAGSGLGRALPAGASMAALLSAGRCSTAALLTAVRCTMAALLTAARRHAACASARRRRQGCRTVRWPGGGCLGPRCCCSGFPPRTAWFCMGGRHGGGRHTLDARGGWRSSFRRCLMPHGPPKRKQNTTTGS